MLRNSLRRTPSVLFFALALCFCACAPAAAQSYYYYGNEFTNESVQSTSATCNAATKGAIRYNGATSAFEACNGTAWGPLPGAAAAGSTGDIQFNSGNSFSASTNLVFTSAGRLGVGTATPATALDIKGQVTIEGTAASVSLDTLSAPSRLILGANQDIEVNAVWPNGGNGTGDMGESGGQNYWANIYMSGGLWFGVPGTVEDTELYRNAASVLRTNSSLIVDGHVGIGTATPGEMLYVSSGNLVDATTLALGSASLPTLAESGAGTRMMWYPKKAAFRAGHVSGSNWDEASIGNYSMAWGQNTEANQTDSTAWGDSTSALGQYSTAWGISTSALGQGTTAWGSGAQASNTDSTAWGDGTIANHQDSTAWGSGSTASGAQATAWGFNTTASGTYSTAWGYYATAAGTASTALGRYVKAGTTADTNGMYSLAVGLTNTSTASYPDITGSYDMGVFMGDQHNDVISGSNIAAFLGGDVYIDPTTGGGLSVASAAEALDINGRIHMAQGTAPGTTTDRLYNVGGTLYWNGTALGSGGGAWSGLTNPAANLGLSMGAYTSTFTYGAATGANNLFALLDTKNNTGTGSILFVSTASGSHAAPLRLSTQAGASNLIFTSAGRLGVGTATPGTPSDGSNDVMAVSANSDTSLMIETQGGTSGPQLSLYGNTSDGQHNWKLFSEGSANSGGGAGYFGIRDETAGLWDLVINPSGNVGIGTTNPPSPLSVTAAGTGMHTLMELQNDNTQSGTADEGPAISFVAGGTGSGNGNAMGEIGAAPDSTGNLSAGYLAFYTRTSDTVTERMRITSAGRVGIGTTNPTSGMLDIFGGGGGSDWESFDRTDGTAVKWSINAANHNFNVYDDTSGIFGLTVATNGYVGIDNTGPGALLDIGTAATTLGTLRLENSNAGGYYTQIQPSTSATASVTYTLPTTAGTSGQVLSTNGAGALSWVTKGVTEATMSGGPYDDVHSCMAGGADQPECSVYVFPRDHTLLRVVIQIVTPPTGCTHCGAIGVQDLTAGQTTLWFYTFTGTESSNTVIDSGAISVAMPAGDQIGVGTTDYSSGQSTTASVLVTATYQ